MTISVAMRAGLLLALFGIQSNLLASGTNAEISKCKALMNINDNLYLTDTTGKLLAQYTSNESSKSAVSVAPNGARVAFIPDDVPDSITIANSDGWKSAFKIPVLTRSDNVDSDADSKNNGKDTAASNIPDNAVLIATAWVDDETLKLTYHVSPTASLFKFITIGPRMAPRLDPTKVVTGVDCTVGHHFVETVCIDGKDVLYNNKIIYGDSGFMGVPVQDVITLRVGGTSGSIQGIPGIQLRAQSIDTGTGKVTLHVTLADGSWSEQTVDDKDYMSILISADQSLGLFPVTIDRHDKVVKLKILVAQPSKNAFNVLALWSDVSRRIALVKNDQTAGNSIIVLSFNDSGNWDVLGPLTLAINEPIRKIRFVSPNQLYVETDSRTGILPLTVVNSDSGPTIQVGSVTYFPATINVNLNQQTIVSQPLTWACN